MPADWWQIIFNPSFPTASCTWCSRRYLSVAFVVGAVGACHLLRDRQNQAARLMFSMAMWMAVIVAPIQIVAGDQHGLNTRNTSRRRWPRWRATGTREPGTPLILFGMPEHAEERTTGPCRCRISAR